MANMPILLVDSAESYVAPCMKLLVVSFGLLLGALLGDLLKAPERSPPKPPTPLFSPELYAIIIAMIHKIPTIPKNAFIWPGNLFDAIFMKFVI